MFTIPKLLESARAEKPSSLVYIDLVSELCDPENNPLEVSREIMGMTRKLIQQERLVLIENKSTREKDLIHQIKLYPDFGNIKLPEILIPQNFKELVENDRLNINSQVVILSSFTRDFLTKERKDDTRDMKL